jgi:hypothetical protein
VSIITLINKCVTRPSSYSGVDWGTPLLPGLLRVYAPLPGFHKLYSPNGLVDTSLIGSPLETAGPLGPSINFDGSNDSVQESSSPIGDNLRGTLFALCRPNTGLITAQSTVMSLCTTAIEPLFRISSSGSTTPVGRWMFQIRTHAGSTNLIPNVNTIVAGQSYFLIATCDGSLGEMRLYVDGVKIGTANAPAQSTLNRSLFAIGSNGRSLGDLPFVGQIYLAGLASESINDAQAQELSCNPWQLFSPQKRAFYFDVGAGGSSDITGSGNITEDADTGSGTSTVAVSVSGETSEASDISAGTADLVVVADAVIAEQDDVAQASAGAPVSGGGAGAETDDTADGSASAAVTADAVIIESSDAASGTGTIGNTLSAYGSVVEHDDTAAGAAAVGITGSGIITDSADNSSGSASAQISAVGAGTESDDATSGAAAAQIAGSGQVNEQSDAASGTGSADNTVDVVGVITEQSDTVTGTVTVAVSGPGAISEDQDAGAGSAAVPVSAVGGVTEQDDVAETVGELLFLPHFVRPGIRSAVPQYHLISAIPERGLRRAS